MSKTAKYVRRKLNFCNSSTPWPQARPLIFPFVSTTTTSKELLKG
jgi:hypothetical protein